MQTDCRPQKRGRGLVGPCSDPLVGPRDPACRDALGAAPHSSCSCDRLVCLATSPSGRRTRSPHQKQTATVMLGTEVSYYGAPCRKTERPETDPAFFRMKKTCSFVALRK